MEMEILSVLATPAGTAAVAIYFVHKFMAFHKETVDKCLEDAAEDRKLFLQAITKIDTRLSYLEKLVEKIMEKQ
tara:strand:+ start:357 stop:578 length:222 start_codon:yes stop_codon:yes gene_type:complete